MYILNACIQVCLMHNDIHYECTYHICLIDDFLRYRHRENSRSEGRSAFSWWLKGQFERGYYVALGRCWVVTSQWSSQRWRENRKVHRTEKHEREEVRGYCVLPSNFYSISPPPHLSVFYLSMYSSFCQHFLRDSFRILHACTWSMWLNNAWNKTESLSSSLSFSFVYTCIIDVKY